MITSVDTGEVKDLDNKLLDESLWTTLEKYLEERRSYGS